MLKRVEKNNTGLVGEIIIPADKSISHRAVMLSSIANGEMTISNFSSGADCYSTLEVFKQLGVDISFIDEKTVRIKGGKLVPTSQNHIYHCGNSGTTMRLVSGILAGQNFDSILTGDDSLSKRPMKRIIEPLIKMGADIKLFGRTAVVTGVSALHGASVKAEDLRGGAALVLAGLGAEGKTIVNDIRHIERGYYHFDKKLKALGAEIKRKT